MKPATTPKRGTSPRLVVRRQTVVVLTHDKLAGVHGGDTSSGRCAPADA